MLPVHKFVDMGHAQFKGKTDLELWYMMDEVTRQMVTVEYMGEQVREGLDSIGKMVISTITLQHGGANVPSVFNPDMAIPTITHLTDFNTSNSISTTTNNSGSGNAIILENTELPGSN